MGIERGVRQCDSEVSDNEVSNNEVSDNEVSDNEVSDYEADNEMSDNEMSDNEMSDNEVSDNEVSDDEVSDIVSAASINAANNVSRDSTHASPRTSSPLNHLESAPVPNFIVETVPLKSILAKSVDPTVESTQKAKKSVHWGRELVRMKITRTHFQRLSNPSDFKPWTAFPTLE